MLQEEQRPGRPLAESHYRSPSGAPQWQNLPKGSRSQSLWNEIWETQPLHHRWEGRKKGDGELRACRETPSKCLTQQIWTLHTQQAPGLVCGCLSSVFLPVVIGALFFSDLTFPSLALFPSFLPLFLYSFFFNLLSFFVLSLCFCWVSIYVRVWLYKMIRKSSLKGKTFGCV